MSDGEFLWYAGALAAAGLLFLILAVLGLGQGLVLRVLDVLLGLAFLGYAGYLMVVAPESPFMSWFVFATPALGLAVAVVARRRYRVKMKRLEEDHSSPPYAGPPTAQAERQPFPTPPPPLDPSAPAPEKKAAGSSAGGSAAGPMPSGLPPSGLGEYPVEAEPRPPRPSGLPQSPPATDLPLRSAGPSSAHGFEGTRPHAEPRPAHGFDAAQPHGPARGSDATQPHGLARGVDAAQPHGLARGSDAAQPHGLARGSDATQPHAEPGEPGYRARHGASDDETAVHDYARGRHRADGE
jgi:hypothetical protein